MKRKLPTCFIDHAMKMNTKRLEKRLMRHLTSLEKAVDRMIKKHATK